MVHPMNECILNIRHIQYLFISLAAIVIYIYIYGIQLVAATELNSLKDEFHEDLYIRPLPDGKLLAYFQFRTIYRKDIKSLRWENKIEILPLTIVDLVTTTGLTELHFSLTKGNWNYKNWGYPTRSSPPGAQIRASFSKHSKNLDEIWSRLTNSLAGKFCASLASANEQTRVFPKYSFSSTKESSYPEAMVDPDQLLNLTSSSDQILYSNLPDEILCTGNLTPWKKLLPCYSSAGLASLLNPINIFHSSYSSLLVDLETISCSDKNADPISGCEQVQLTQSVSIVFNPLQQFEGKQTWSLAKTFGSSIKSSCPVSRGSFIHVDITNADDKSKLYPQQGYKEYLLHLGPTKETSIKRRYATFDINTLLHNTSIKTLNVGMKHNQLFKRPAFSSRKDIPIYLRTHTAGLGAFDGTIVATITNSLSVPIRITYMDIVPHFMRLYLHTLHIRHIESGQELKPDKLNFMLSQDDKTPTLIEFRLLLPAKSDVQISYDFERAFLRWTDYKPDANKGVLLSSAVISFPARHTSVLEQLVSPLCLQPSRLERIESKTTATGANNSTSDELKLQELQLTKLDEEMIRVYARPLLIISPTPDFSMPYNVLCLVSTVLVFAFGPIYNLTIRRPVVKRHRKQSRGTDAKKDD